MPSIALESVGNHADRSGSVAQRRRRMTQLYTTPDPGTSLTETARLAARCIGFPIAQINVLDDAFQYRVVDWDADPVRMAERGARPPVLPRRSTMCQFTVGAGVPLAVDDLGAVPRYAALPGARSGIARSYLGVPIRSRESDIIGSLCVMDRRTRHITADQMRSLTEFAHVVEDQLDLVRRTRESNTVSGTGAAKLARAIDAGEIVPWYQPIVELSTGRTSAYEALARWVHPGGEIEDPSRFVPLAEDSHLVVELDLAVARQAVADLGRWQAAGRDVGIHVNLSPLHLELDGGVDAIRGLLDGTGLDPSRVTLELTESRRLTDVEHAARAVADLRCAGFNVVLDDFGTGCSSLDWLLALPINGLKMDRAVTSALDSRVGRAVTRAATGLARDLDLSLILEGISAASHVAGALEQGYRYGQGYFWSPPEPAGKIGLHPEAD